MPLPRTPAAALLAALLLAPLAGCAEEATGDDLAAAPSSRPMLHAAVLDEIDLPPPGHGVLMVGEQRFEVTVTCKEEDWRDGTGTRFLVDGRGTVPDGRKITLTAARVVGDGGYEQDKLHLVVVDQPVSQQSYLGLERAASGAAVQALDGEAEGPPLLKIAPPHATARGTFSGRPEGSASGEGRFAATCPD
jgi:hypothetical protein